jgi:hypothetical protein
VLKVEVAELKSRPTLLGACTSCPVLHGKNDEMHAYIVSLDADLKALVPTSRSTCELHAIMNLDLFYWLKNIRCTKALIWTEPHIVTNRNCHNPLPCRSHDGSRSDVAQPPKHVYDDKCYC